MAGPAHSRGWLGQALSARYNTRQWALPAPPTTTVPSGAWGGSPKWGWHDVCRSFLRESGIGLAISAARAAPLSRASLLDAMRGLGSLRASARGRPAARRTPLRRGYKAAAGASHKPCTRLCASERSGSGQHVLRTGSPSMHASCGRQTPPQHPMIPGPRTSAILRGAEWSVTEWCRARTGAPWSPGRLAR